MQKRCCYCYNDIYPYGHPENHKLRHKMTKDHIFPQSYYTKEFQRLMCQSIPGFRRLINIKYCCQKCNNERGQVGHCPGALMAARSYPGGHAELRRYYGKIINRYGNLLNYQMRKELTR